MSRISFFGSIDMSSAENIDLQEYRETAEVFMCSLLPDSPTATSSRTSSKILFAVTISHELASSHSLISSHIFIIVA